MSKCPMCGTPASFEIRLPDGTVIPAATEAEAQGLLRTYQRCWEEDLSISICPQTPHQRRGGQL